MHTNFITGSSYISSFQLHILEELKLCRDQPSPSSPAEDDGNYILINTSGGYPVGKVANILLSTFSPSFISCRYCYFSVLLLFMSSQKELHGIIRAPIWLFIVYFGWLWKTRDHYNLQDLRMNGEILNLFNGIFFLENHSLYICSTMISAQPLAKYPVINVTYGLLNYCVVLIEIVM